MPAHHQDCSCLSAGAKSFDRRRFLTLAALGGGAYLLAPRFALAAGGTDTLLLSCMDYRLMGDVARYMESRGLGKNYDHVILAGASLGALTDKQPAWGDTFMAHVDVAIKLHHIKQVLVMDHRDCGAYKVFLGADLAGDPAKETEIHAEQLKKLRRKIMAFNDSLVVELLLMSLDGKVEKIA